MHRTTTALILVGTATWFGCGGERTEAPPMPVQPEGPAPVAATWRPPAPVPPTPTEVGVAPSTCGFQPPAILGPADATPLSGSVAISSTLVPRTCSSTAGTVFKVVNPSGLIVHSACDGGSPARTSWDTRGVPNGQYWITAQSTCGCTPCAEYSFVEVSVRN